MIKTNNIYHSMVINKNYSTTNFTKQECFLKYFYIQTKKSILHNIKSFKTIKKKWVTYKTQNKKNGFILHKMIRYKKS